MRRVPAVLVAVLALFASLALAACGDDTTTTDDVTDDDTTDDDATATTTEAVEVGLYFVAEVGEPAAGGVVDAIAATRRSVDVPVDRHPAEATLTALLDGPSPFEAEIGMTSAVPPTTALLGVTVADGVADVDLDAAFEEPSGSFTDTLRVAQVVFTLTGFDDVDTVRFAIDGDQRETVGSHGIDVSGTDGAGIARDDVPEARPPILLETPAPGAPVTDPLTIAGESNTFEGTVRWALTDPEGRIVDEGFLTATAGSGVWGTFSAEIGAEATADRGGLGAVILWEDSPEDGRQTNIVEVPVTWPDA